MYMNDLVKSCLQSSYKNTVSSTYPLQNSRDTGTTSWNTIKKAMRNITVFSIVLLLLYDIFEQYAGKIYQHNFKTFIYIIAF